MNRIAFHVGRWVAVGGLCAGLSLTLPALAQSGSGQQGQSAQSSSTPATQGMSGQMAGNPNQRAVDYLNTLNAGEVKTAKLMQDKAQNAQVKDYAKMLEQDHEKAQDQLQDAASKASLQLNTNQKMAAREDKLDSRLQNASAIEADREYLHAEARGHASALRHVRMLEKQVTDPGLKSYIADYIPVLQKHLRATHSLEASLGMGHAAGTPASKATPPQSKQPPRL